MARVPYPFACGCYSKAAMPVSRTVAGALVAAAFVASVAASAPAGHPQLATAALELAPGELGAVRSAGSLALAPGAKGKEILLFDGGSGELGSYLETGAAWAKPVRLRDRQGAPFSPAVFRFKVDGDRIAFAGPRGVDLFRRDTGEHAGGTADLHHAADVEAMPGGGWVVNLMWLPIPELVRAAKARFDGTEPRLVVVGGDLAVSRHGLAADARRTGNETAARTLRLAASADRLYAAELANYKVYELDRRLKLRATYLDPNVQLEKGLGLPPDGAMRKRYAAEAERQIARTGKDAAKASRPPETREAEFFSYQPAIEDLAWDQRSRQLVLLLAPGIANDVGALDLLDPATGEVRRLLLRLPEGLSSYGPLAQVVVGYRYLWLRNYPGGHPTLRLDRSALAEARPIRPPKVERAGAS